MGSEETYKKTLEAFQKATKKPELFLSVNEDLQSSLTANLKSLYDFTKSQETQSPKSNALPELIVNNFDNEQIWQQLELQNDSLLTNSLTRVSKLVVNKSSLLFKNLQDTLRPSSRLSNEGGAPSSDDNSKSKDDQNESDIESVGINDIRDQINDEEDFTDDQDDSGDEQNRDIDMESEPGENEESSSKGGNKRKSSVVDDKFFKLSEMESFLQAEEKKANDPDSGNDSKESSDESDEESVDLFKEASEDDEAVKARYKDFFVEKKDTAKGIKRNKFLERLSDEDDSEADLMEDDENAVKSSLELRQERLNRKIAEIEENAIKEKPWQLKGEITADGRPQNSLLEEFVEFDLTTRPAPVITEQTTLQLEDIIRQRIKDKAFDSVERKVKPTETPLEYKKKLVLDQEKSKQSLAQIYEQEYLEQQSKLDPENAEKEEEEPELHKEIRKMMSNLFNKLDALSNFHFTPKPAAPELKIISNLPAISMEEVAPVATSDAALLAPEEIKAKPKGDIIGKSERSDTDKNRERRHKKKKQHLHALEKQKNLLSKAGLGNKYSKQKAKQLLENVTKSKNIDKMDESLGSKSVKSSSAFFTQLQEEVQTQIKNKSKSKTNKKVNKIDAKKIKL